MQPGYSASALCHACCCLAWRALPSCLAVRSGMLAVMVKEAGLEGPCVRALLLPWVCAVRKEGLLSPENADGCSWLAGTVLVCLELWTKRFSSMPGRCAGTRWDGDTVCRSRSGISALITAYTTAFLHAGVGCSNSILSFRASLNRVHPGRKSRKSWRCDGLKSS